MSSSPSDLGPLTLPLKTGVWSLITNNKEEEKRVGGKLRKKSLLKNVYMCAPTLI